MLEFIAELKTVGGLTKSSEVWYVIYVDGKGERKKVKGAQPLVAAMIRNRKLTADATASRQKTGEFLPLGDIPEFAPLFEATSQAGMENGASNRSSSIESNRRDEPVDFVAEPSSESANGSRFESIPGSTGRSFLESGSIGDALSNDAPFDSNAPIEPAPVSNSDASPVSPMLYVGAAAVIILLLLAAFIAGRLTN
jgi:hypothetical protein